MFRLKVHEDWGSTPAAIDTALRVAEEMDVQIMIHTDTLNESCCVEQTIEAFKVNLHTSINYRFGKHSFEVTFDQISDIFISVTFLCCLP